MSLGVEKLLPSDCLNINEFRVIHMDICSDAIEYSLEQELMPTFHNFGGKTRCTRGEEAHFPQYKAGDQRVASSRLTGVAVYVLLYSLLSTVHI